ncbi:DNA replication ATP-dependent helicase/nuclease DNA2-like isoform X2 [Papaver somniferum]|uniref:DNA replication ATP-dependent helicase/nuclease DNA2-like isoform X2 n=1 Tax=Papaver somniferum TaxID=3469 RepID=UPI000E6F984B|nr:DNA replication ATP-dependent helicase/nuclease DNA2-like isoform X2 [Papaver somniferum]
MAPRKKSITSSSIKKSNQTPQQSQPSIERLFKRHTQNSQKPKNVQNSQTSTTPINNPPKISTPPDLPPISDAISRVNVVADEEICEISPETSKCVSFKRFKFSPGMLIKQSQDDGVEEVTWRVSPVNDRLQAVNKHFPDTIRVLANASKLNASHFRQCSNKDSCSTTGAKLETWLSSPTLKPIERSLMFSNEPPLREVDQNQDMEVHISRGSTKDKKNVTAVSQQSPFHTPPSLSYSSDVPVNGSMCKGASDQLGSRQHRKALLELLDQVEDVIAVEDSVPHKLVKPTKNHDLKGGQLSINSNPRPNIPQIVDSLYSNLFFLVLEVSEKHKTVNSSSSSPVKVLRLLNEKNGEERTLHLHDEWFNSVVGPGDTVHVVGEFDNQGKCVVDHSNNLLIVHPEILLSGSQVSTSFNCARRAVLDERLKRNEYSVAPLVGVLLHEIFQAGLVKEHPTKEFLEEYARVVLHKNLESMYACGVNENEIHRKLIDAIPKLLTWFRSFKNLQEPKGPTVDFGSKNEYKNVNVVEVMDIEEMVWAPKYGLKGKFDASLRVKVHTAQNGSSEKIMPLEFKSGKATTGQSFMEHSAQVVLYTLLMSERYLQHIGSGLLYYLHTDQTQGIVPQRSDIIGLIIRRNELANDILKASTVQQLPPMLQNPNVCKGCRHLNACLTYHKSHGGNKDSSGLPDLFDAHVEHLTRAHSDFLRHWDRLIDLEANDKLLAKKEIWHSQSLRSGRSTNGLSSLILDDSNEFLRHKSPNDSQFVYRFVQRDSQDPEMTEETVGSCPSLMGNLECTLRTGDYIILSTESRRVALAKGVITDIIRSHVSISFPKCLRLPWSKPSSETEDLLQEVWRIDKDEYTASFAIMRFNLTQLFLQSTESTHLRKMIVDLEAPRFDSGVILSQDPAVAYIRSEKNLNDDQRRAIHKILTVKDYALILGMPGTGKTSTMVHAVKALLMRGASILLTSYTNSAIDNLLIKLKAQGIDFVRLGRSEAVHSEIRDHCFSATNTCSVESIRLRMEQVKVVAVTCIGITNPLLAKKRFDLCIMDEAGQTTLPVSLGPLMFASKFVLVGDHYQLPPLVESTEARETGLGVSLFCRLSEAHPQAISALQSQYRMCSGVMELSNALIYGNRLRCGSSQVANAKLRFSSLKSSTSWLKEVLDTKKSVVLINTDMLPALEVKDNKTVNNPTEAYIVAEITEELVNRGIIGEDIGIITPYNSQVSLIRRVVGTLSVEIHTIDKYQGRDKDCIIVSFVRSTESPKGCSSSLLGDWHRINVALTRAKKKLIMVGSCKTLSKVPLLRLLIEKVDEQSGIMNVSKKDIHHFSELKRCSSKTI